MNVPYGYLLFVILACFYLTFFGKQISLRKQGISSNRLGKGDKPERTRKIERLLMIMTYSMAAVQLLSVFFSSSLGAFGLPDVVRILGIVISSLGVVFFVLAVTAMQNNWRAGVDKEQNTSLVSNGIYRYSRNPAFVGFFLLYIGTALTVPNITIVVFAVISIIVFHLQVLEEEKFLSSSFGESYDSYEKRTARYLF